MSTCQNFMMSRNENKREYQMSTMREQHEYKTKYNNKMRPNESSYLRLINYINKNVYKNECNKSTNRIHNEKKQNEILILGIGSLIFSWIIKLKCNTSTFTKKYSHK